MPTKKSVDSWISELDPAIRPLCEALRRIILGTAPQLEESIKWGNPVYEKNGKILYLSAADSYATLGFFNGAGLTDPQGRIEGAGKKMRHSKVRAVEEMDVAQLESWVREAVALDAATAV